MVSIMCFSFRFVGSVCVLTDPREGRTSVSQVITLSASFLEAGARLATRKSYDPPVFALHSTGFFISIGIRTQVLRLVFHGLLYPPSYRTRNHHPRDITTNHGPPPLIAK